VSADPETIAHARALCDAGNFDEAGELLRLVLAVEPDDREAWCLLACAELGGGRHAEAILAADRAAAIDPAFGLPTADRSLSPAPETKKVPAPLAVGRQHA
jgi:Flp pilus assembly protein TadD